MSFKDQLLDFLNLIFIVVLVILCIFYFIAGDNFSAFSLFLKSMVPLAFIGIIFLVKLKMTRSEIRKRRDENNTEIVLELNVMDKLIADVVVFFTPILLGLLIYKIKGSLGGAEVIEISIVFLIMFFWQKYIFRKER